MQCCPIWRAAWSIATCRASAAANTTHGCRYLAEGFVEIMRGYVYYEPYGNDES